MKTRSVKVRACGFIDASGFGGNGVRHPWKDGKPRRLRWSLFSQKPFDRFGRLDPLSKHVLVAVEMLGLKGSLQGTGLVLGTAFGSLAVDVEFHATIGRVGGASPALFTYTLPSVSIGEVAIRHRIIGPSLCLLAGGQSGAAALWEGFRLIADGELPSCVCIGADALTPSSRPMVASFPFAPTGNVGSAYAFLLDGQERAQPSLAQLSLAPTGNRDELLLEGGLKAVYDHLTRWTGRSEARHLPAPRSLKADETMCITPLPRSGMTEG